MLVAFVLERAAPSHIVQKRFADAFHETALDKLLQAHQVDYITQADMVRKISLSLLSYLNTPKSIALILSRNVSSA